ncbi:MAG: hypothetical protein ACO390_19165 [bacterium]
MALVHLLSAASYMASTPTVAFIEAQYVQPFGFRLRVFAVYASKHLLPPVLQNSLHRGLTFALRRGDFHP